MADYTPDTEQVREQYTREQPPHIGTVSEKSAQFERWLDQVKEAERQHAEEDGRAYLLLALCEGRYDADAAPTVRKIEARALRDAADMLDFRSCCDECDAVERIRDRADEIEAGSDD